VEIDAAQGSLYEGQTFQLRFKFNERYPFDSPSVTFIGHHIPEHSHIYSNGHICLSILSDDWTPALSVQAVCLSILSMLSSAKKKERPRDDLI
jgi:ubiquitin-conjugating enzyme E2 W